MATFQLSPEFNEAIVLTDEADTIVVPEGDASRDRVFNFDPASDRMDISRLSGVTVRDLLSGSISTQNGLLLMGSFGSINLLEVAADQLSEDNFIIGGGNQPPIEIEPPAVPIADFAITTVDSAVDIDVLANDFGIGGGPAMAIASFEETTANGGTVTLKDNNSPDDPSDDLLEYTPPEGFTGSDSFTYAVSGGTTTATVIVEVRPIDGAGPVAVDDTAIVTEDRPETIAVLANDLNPEGRAFGLIRFERTTSNGGTVTRDPNGTRRRTDDGLVYTPAAGFVGTDSVTYSISDAKGNFSTATVNVTVESAPEPGPVATDDRASVLTGESETIAVLENDFNPDGGAFGLIRFERRTANGGTVTRDDNGTRRLTDDRLLYTPPTGFIGSDSFTYSISDALGNVDTAVVNVTVEDIGDNQPPIAFDDFAFTDGNIPVNIFVLDNDLDPDGDAIAIVGFDETTAFGGDVSQQGDSLVYTPALGFTGTDSFIYTITDGELTSTATVNVEVYPCLGQQPLAFDDFAFTTEDIPVNIFVLDNDFDPDFDPIAIVGFDETTAFGGDVSQQGDSLVYTPALGFTGTDSFIYTINNIRCGFTDTATVVVTVAELGVNEPPIALDDFAETNENIPVSIFPLDNDFDPDGDIIFIAGFDETTANGGDVSQNGNSLVYTPAFGFFGTDSYIYTISDFEGFTDTATVSVEVIEDPPHFIGGSDDIAFTEENTPVTIFVLDNNFVPDGVVLEIVAVSETTASGGEIGIEGNSLVYTPAFGFTGTDSFIYTLGDGERTDTETVTVIVSEAGDNEPPIASDDFAITDGNIPVNIFVLDNDFDSDGDAISIAGFDETTANGGDVSQNGSVLVYTPPLPSCFTTDSFSYSITDGEFTSTATVNVEVYPPPEPPIAFDDFAFTFEGIPVNIFVLDNDFDSETLVYITGFFETTAAGGTVALDGDSLQYTPPDGFTGTDSFNYTVVENDICGRVGIGTATVTVSVEANGDNQPPPIASDDFAFTTENSSVSVFVLDNDGDPDGDPIFIAGFDATTANGGDVSQRGEALVYTSAEGFTGTDNFIYSIIDGLGGSDAATVNVIVSVRESSPPIASDDFAITDENIPVDIFVLGNDYDLHGDSLEILVFSETTEFGGTFTLSDNSTPDDTFDDFLTYSPALGFTGTDSFDYTISNGVYISSATVTVTVNPLLSLPPIAFDDFALTEENIPVNIFVLDNDGDPEDSFAIAGFSQTTVFGGAIGIEGNSLVYTPAFGFTGTDSFIYTITDGEATYTANVTVSVSEAGDNEPLIASDDFATATESISVNIFVLDNDFDPEGDAIEIAGFDETTESGGDVSISGNSLVYTSAFGFTGIESFIYSITDGELTSTATVNVVVDPCPGQLPIASDDFTSTFEGIPVNIFVLDNDRSTVGNPVSIIGFFETTVNGGTVTLDSGFLQYTPPSGFTGTDSFNYTVAENDICFFGYTSTATVTVSVEANGVNDPPIALDDFSSTTQDATVAIDDFDYDPDGDPLFITDFEEIAFNGGTISRDKKGSQPPIAANDEAEVLVNTAVNIPVLDNDFKSDLDPEDPNSGSSLTIIGFDVTTANGAAVILDNDSLIYTPSPGFTGTDSFTYSIRDGFNPFSGSNPTDTAIVTVSVVGELGFGL